MLMELGQSGGKDVVLNAEQLKHLLTFALFLLSPGDPTA